MMNVPIVLLVGVHLAMYYCQCEAKTVVMIPLPSKSYIIYHSNIAKALIELGHNVTMCVPAFLINEGLVPYKDINIVSYGETLGNIEESTFKRTRILNRFWEGEAPSIDTLFALINAYKEIVDKILAEEAFITILQKMKPDLLILENCYFARNLIVLPYMLDVPFALIGTFTDFHQTRVPFIPVGEVWSYESSSERKSFFQRVFVTLVSPLFYVNNLFSDSDIVTRYAPDKPYKTINEIALGAEIFITELDPILDYPRPSLPNTKFVGGSSVIEAKPVSGELKTFVDNSSNGIIVVSFGSCDIQVPSHIRAKMLEAFRNLEQNVVWKIDWTLDQPGNVLPLKWIPQNDLLGHEKTKLFISHCGKNGQYEALYHGVPILCLPIFGDQPYNSIRISSKEFGLYADIREITSDELTGLIKQLVNVPKYKNNIQKASKLFKELYKVPSKEVAYWFDHVMKYGGEYMRSSYQKMPLYEFLLLDVIAFLIVVVIVILVTFYVIIRLCCKFLYKFNKFKLKIA